MLTRIPIAACIIVAASPTAVAETAGNPGWYFGASAGRSDFDVEPSPFSIVAPAYTESRTRAYSVFAGYRIARYFSLEGGYADLGEVKFRDPGWCSSDPRAVCAAVPYLPVIGEISAQRWDLSTLSILPFAERWDAFAKLGIARTKYSVVSSRFATQADHETKAVLGIGVHCHFARLWSARFHWDRFKGLGGEETEREAAVDTLWLGAEFRL